MFKFWFIFLPSLAKQQREVTKFKVFRECEAHDGEFVFLFISSNTTPTSFVSG